MRGRFTAPFARPASYSSDASSRPKPSRSSARTGNYTYEDVTGVARTVNVLTGASLNLTGANQATFKSAGGVLGVDPTIQSRIISRLPTAGNGTLTGINFLQQFSFERANPETRDQVTGHFDVDIDDESSFNLVFKRSTITDARTTQPSTRALRLSPSLTKAAPRRCTSRPTT